MHQLLELVQKLGRESLTRVFSGQRRRSSTQIEEGAVSQRRKSSAGTRKESITEFTSSTRQNIIMECTPEIPLSATPPQRPKYIGIETKKILKTINIYKIITDFKNNALLKKVIDAFPSI